MYYHYYYNIGVAKKYHRKYINHCLSHQLYVIQYYSILEHKPTQAMHSAVGENVNSCPVQFSGLTSLFLNLHFSYIFFFIWTIYIKEY
jgi:hypothetical protein